VGERLTRVKSLLLYGGYGAVKPERFPKKILILSRYGVVDNYEEGVLEKRGQIWG